MLVNIQNVLVLHCFVYLKESLYSFEDAAHNNAPVPGFNYILSHSKHFDHQSKHPLICDLEHLILSALGHEVTDSEHRLNEHLYIAHRNYEFRNQK